MPRGSYNQRMKPGQFRELTSETCYKPFIHYNASFASLIAITLGLIALLEYATRILPAIDSDAESPQRRSLVELRQGNNELFTTFSLIAAPSNEPEPVTLTTIPGDYLDTSTILSLSAVPSSGQILPAALSDSAAAAATSTQSIGPSDTSYVATPSLPTIVVVTAPNPVPSSSIFLDTSTILIQTYTSNTMTSNTIASNTVASNTVASDTMTAKTSTTLDRGPRSTYTNTITTAKLSITRAITQSGTTTTSSPTIVSTTSMSDTTSVAYASPSPGAPAILANRPLTFFTNLNYFFGSYLAIFLAVIFRIAIGWLYATTKMLEPFHLLAHQTDNHARDFFNINYLSASDTLEPYKAMLKGHWLMLWTSLLYLVAEILSPFASELSYFYPSCESVGDGELMCSAALWINSSVARVLQALLSFVCILLISVWWMLKGRSCGINSDPSSILTIASLLGDPRTINDLRALDQLATKDEIVNALDGRIYRLGTYEANDGNDRYGVISTAKSNFDQLDNISEPLIHGENDRISPVTIPTASQVARPKRKRPLHILRDVVLASTISGTLILVVVYYKNSSNTGFERFMDSNSFGPRFLITCIAVLIHSQWARIERECAVDEPFRLLYAGHATAESTILLSRTLNPISTFIISIYRRAFFVAYVAFVALTSEILIIILPGIPFSPGELFEAAIITFFLCMAILGLMVLTLIALKLRPKGPDLPRKPNTLGAMFLYLCDSSMTPDFADLSTLRTETRDRLVRDMGRRYEIEFGMGSEGRMRWQIDYQLSAKKGDGALMSDF